ncbi:UbiA family prenyltransferase, partial [Bacteroides fragilis]|nr:UbiA family prenyltransferase [Bacteroides fragilis]
MGDVGAFGLLAGRSAAAHTFNNVVDYEIDQKMQRTRARPLVRASIS